MNVGLKKTIQDLYEYLDWDRVIKDLDILPEDLQVEYLTFTLLFIMRKMVALEKELSEIDEVKEAEKKVEDYECLLKSRDLLVEEIEKMSDLKRLILDKLDALLKVYRSEGSKWEERL